jgi:hypothetical protein
MRIGKYIDSERVALSFGQLRTRRQSMRDPLANSVANAEIVDPDLLMGICCAFGHHVIGGTQCPQASAMCA